MILPTKLLREEDCLLNIGAILLTMIDKDIDLSKLWKRAKTNKSIVVFEKFILALDFLYILGLIDIVDQKITRLKQ